MLRVVRHGERLCVETPAKINVGLRVLNRRPDGYHNIESLVMAVSLTDTLEALPDEDGVVSLEVRSEGAQAPADESNLVLRAARLLRERAGTKRGARLTLVKRIPAGRGLGGGSSDGAAALVLLSALWGLNVPRSELVDLAAELGSDVPFFLGSPLAVMRGRGEIIEPVDHKVNVWVVLVIPPFEIPTREVYRRLSPALTRPGGAVRLWQELLLGGHIEELGRCVVNDLESAALALRSELVTLRRKLEETGAPCVSMTGSGSAVYALVARGEDARGMVHDLHQDVGVAVHVLAPWDPQDHSSEREVLSWR